MVAAPVPAQPIVVADQRPSSVTIGIVLLVLCCLVSIFSIVSILYNYPRAATPEFLTRSVGLDVLWILLIIGLWQRQGWARFAILALSIWSLGTLLYSIIRVTSSGGAIFAFAIPMAITAMHFGALFLLFRPDSNAWFKR